MEKGFLSILLLVQFVLFALSGFSRSNNSKEEWIGRWNINHDGFNGKLIITDTKEDCAGTPWCGMVLRYIDQDGKVLQGTIQSITDNWQHMIFYVKFPGNTQKFDAYLFSWDRQDMAGTTYWKGRTFGFYATKKQNLQVVTAVPATPTNNTAAANNQSDRVISKKILPDGTVETRYASGKIVDRNGNNVTTRYPDGTETRMQALSVPQYAPPNAPNDPNINRWLNNMQTNLLDMIKASLLNDQESINNFIGAEQRRHLNIYQKINNRFSFLNSLIAEK